MSEGRQSFRNFTGPRSTDLRRTEARVIFGTPVSSRVESDDHLSTSAIFFRGGIGFFPSRYSSEVTSTRGRERV